MIEKLPPGTFDRMSLYYITHATTESGAITKLKASQDARTALGQVMTKADMIRLLEHGHHGAETWHAGKSAPVRVIDGRYLRSDANDTRADNLGDLPPV